MFRSLGFGALLAMCTAFCVLPAHAADKIGLVVAVVGQPSANGPGGSRTLSKNSEVFENDTISVSGGNAQIQLNDGTRLVVGPNSNLLLDQFVSAGENKASKVAIKALRGTYRFITGRSPKSAYKITTAQATIGIRGTAFDFWVKKKTGAVVLRGAVRLGGRSGGSVDVRSGCQMGEATLNTARPLVGTEKVASIRENLPYIVDQSLLVQRFRLNVGTCRLASGEIDGSDSPRAFPFRGQD